jgi:hypothetical protein
MTVQATEYKLNQLALLPKSFVSKNENLGLGRETMKRLAEFEKFLPSTGTPNQHTVTTALDSALFEANAEAKIYVSQVAMHISREWRDKLFRQLDTLLDTDEFEEDDAPLNVQSFRVFLKYILQMRPPKRPGLGLTRDGLVIAYWGNETRSFNLEFRIDERAKFYYFDGRPDDAVQLNGLAPLSSLFDYLPWHLVSDLLEHG